MIDISKQDIETQKKNEYIELDFSKLKDKKLLPAYIVGFTLIIAFGYLLFASPNTPRIFQKDTDLTQMKFANASDTFETFKFYDNEVCIENGKPLVVTFVDAGCPNCEWIDDTFDNWVKSRDDITAYKYEWYTGDNHYTEEVEDKIPSEHLQLFYTFAEEERLPQFIFGCRYAREENAYEEEDNLDKEVEVFNKVADAIQ